MVGKDLRIVYMGTPDFAVAPLRSLVEGGYNVVAVVTSVDKPAGRGLKIQKSPVKQYAESVGLNILQPDKLRDEGFVQELKGLNLDLGIVIAFRMLPEIIWSLPKMGTFNLHASLLPKYRGAAPINWAIINGEKSTGVTTFMLNSKIDEGDIIDCQEVQIETNDNVATLHDKLMYTGVDLVLKSVDDIASGIFTIVPQKYSKEITLAPKIFKDTCRVDWNRNCESLYNFIRGLSPYPGAWCNLSNGDDELSMKIFEVSYTLISHDFDAGKIFSDNKSFLNIYCSDGYISILSLQLSGKRRMDVGEFLRGFNNIEQFHVQ